MIGNNLLNQIIIEKEKDNPGEILSLLSNGMISVFNRTGSEQMAKDGMDMTLCVFDIDTETGSIDALQFAGAQNPLFLISNGELTQIKGDEQPIGGRTKLNYQFTNHKIELQKGDAIYIFSDGYQDQFGGDRDEKFTPKRFKQLLLNIQEKSMEKQKQILAQTIQKWKNDREQLDDMLVIGVKV